MVGDSRWRLPDGGESCSLSESEFEFGLDAASVGSVISWSSMVVESPPRDWTKVESHNTGAAGVRVGGGTLTSVI